MVYSFTDDDLAMALIEAENSGLEVAGVMDKAQALSNTGGDTRICWRMGSKCA